MHDRDKSAKEKPIGPFAPPKPKEAEGGDPEPMAVAEDKQQSHGESFVATSAPRDQYDPEVARRFGRGATRPARSDKETRAAQHPDGYEKPGPRGWAKPKDDEEI